MIFKQIQEIIDELKKETRRQYKPGEYAMDRDGNLVIAPEGKCISDHPIDIVYTPSGRVKWRVLGFYTVVPQRGKPGVEWDRNGHYESYPDKCPMAIDEWHDKYSVAGWMRLSIRIERIRWERLGDISRQDALAEGIVYDGNCYHSIADRPGDCISDAVSVYRRLWEYANGPHSWNPDMFVWPISFGLVKSHNFTTINGVTYYS